MADGTADNVVDLAARRPPVTYFIQIDHGSDDSFGVTVRDLADTPENHAKLAETMRRAADCFEHGVWTAPIEPTAVDSLAEQIEATIDRFHVDHPDLQISTITGALEAIRRGCIIGLARTVKTNDG